MVDRPAPGAGAQPLSALTRSAVSRDQPCTTPRDRASIQVKARVAGPPGGTGITEPLWAATASAPTLVPRSSAPTVLLPAADTACQISSGSCSLPPAGVERVVIGSDPAVARIRPDRSTATPLAEVVPASRPSTTSPDSVSDPAPLTGSSSENR